MKLLIDLLASATRSYQNLGAKVQATHAIPATLVQHILLSRIYPIQYNPHPITFRHLTLSRDPTSTSAPQISSTSTPIPRGYTRVQSTHKHKYNSQKPRLSSSAFSRSFSETHTVREREFNSFKP